MAVSEGKEKMVASPDSNFSHSFRRSYCAYAGFSPGTLYICTILKCGKIKPVFYASSSSFLNSSKSSGCFNLKPSSRSLQGLITLFTGAGELLFPNTGS